MIKSASILVVEDELITAESIFELLEQEDFKMIGVAKDAATAFQLCDKEIPQVVVCDINIKGEINGIELAKLLKQKFGCQIVFLTAYTDIRTVESAAAVEPVMYVIKPYNDVQLLVAVQMAFHRLYKKQMPKINEQLQLTGREREIASLVAQGFSSKEIAKKLFISEETVKTHRRRMLQKNNINNFPQLIYMMGGS
ncbi:response regulator transcription factor [Flavihumibacter sp.]|uniref:response regulator transcription factor n=1 Tax=Flavihumibacter sp. TaxID=1913981 RepID=UPI002FC6FE8A